MDMPAESPNAALLITRERERLREKGGTINKPRGGRRWGDSEHISDGFQQVLIISL